MLHNKMSKGGNTPIYPTTTTNELLCLNNVYDCAMTLLNKKEDKEKGNNKKITIC